MPSPQLVYSTKKFRIIMGLRLVGSKGQEPVLAMRIPFSSFFLLYLERIGSESTFPLYACCFYKASTSNFRNVIQSNDFISSISKHFFRMEFGWKCKSAIIQHIFIEFPQHVPHYSRYLQHLVKEKYIDFLILQFSILTGVKRDDYTHNSSQ